MLPPTPTQHYLGSIRFRRKFPFLRLLLFLIDLKSTIICFQILFAHIFKQIINFSFKIFCFQIENLFLIPIVNQ